MKVDIILPTYNRPKLVQVAIKSILSQHSGDWELWVYDDGSDYDFKGRIIDKYTDPRIHFFQGPKLGTEERFETCRYAVIINMLLKKSSNELVSYLCDDDFYWPEAIGGAVQFFKDNPEKFIGFGILTYSEPGHKHQLRKRRKTRYPSKPVGHRFGALDQNQVVHRRVCLQHARWLEGKEAWPRGDAHLFRDLAKKYLFYPMGIWFANKYMHLRRTQALLGIRRGASKVRE